MSDVITVRSLEDVSYLLNILFFNMNNLSRIYYDMFINPEPMDIELQRYDEAGNLVTITLPNRAKDVIQAYTGNGNPNGIQVAKVGAFYIDITTSDLYYKGSGTDAYGWILVYSSINSNYLRPNGNGSQLTNLNASSIDSGTLAVEYGGTGNNTLNGVLKGNGVSPITNAEDGGDFLGPISTVGIICYYPVSSIPYGWLLCDGSAYSRVTYARLFNKIGVQYGEGNGTTTFNVPNLTGYFIRGWSEGRSVNVPQEGTVGGHVHNLSGSTGAGTAHNHTRGTMDIKGTAWGESSGSSGWNVISGAFYKTTTTNKWGHDSHDTDNNLLGFQASKNWTGNTSSESSHTHPLTGSTANNAEGTENMVRNLPMYPIIKW